MSLHLAFPLNQADAVARELLSAVASIAVDSMIVGSVRRKVARVHDVEVLVLPLRGTPQSDLFGELHVIDSTPVAEVLRRRAGWKVLAKSADAKIIRLIHTPTKTPCEIYIVDDPRSWGSHVVVRTGPQAFSINAMQRARQQGKHFANGFLLHGHPAASMPCPEGPECPFILELPKESDLFAVLGIPWKEPEERR